MARTTTLGAIMSEWLELFGRTWLTILAYFGFFGVILAGVDIGASASLGERFDPDGRFQSSQLIVFAVYLLIGNWIFCESLKKVMTQEGFAPMGGPLIFLTVIWAGLLTAVPILVGFMMLIFPGFILMARWSIAPALIVSQGQSAFEGLKGSWTVTASSQGAIATASLLLMLANVVAGIFIRLLTIGFGTRLSSDPQSSAVLVYRIAGQMFTSLGMAFSLLLCVSVYKLLDGRRNELDQIYG